MSIAKPLLHPPPALINSAICDAIARRRVLQLRYRQEESTRLVEPHAYGMGSRGQPQLLAWQTLGPSSSGWKRFAVADLSEVVAIDAEFMLRPDFNPSDPLFVYVWAMSTR